MVCIWINWDHFCLFPSLILLMLLAFRKPRLKGSFLNPIEDEFESWFDLGVTPRPFRFIVLHSHFLPVPHFSHATPLSFFTDLYSAPLLGSISLSITFDLLKYPH